MAEPTKSDPLTAELENRLDELFQEDGPPAETVPPRTARQQPLAELKKTVLSIDWEITPEAVDSFLAQIRLLKEVYSNDQAATVLLQILGSLGQYIKSSRSKVHPSTFSLLNSVFARLEEVTHHPGMPELTKRKLLQAQMSAYQQLREKVSKRRTTDRSRPAPARTPATAPAGPPAAGGAVSAAMLAQAMAELKEFIRAEMDALRREMKTGPSR